MWGGRRRRSRATSGPPAIPGYCDLRVVGSGGFSTVYTAYQERFARTVAVKVVTVELSDDALRRFQRELLTAGQLDGHPHVIRVYESGFTDGGQPYLTMELHEQGSLADRLRRQGPLPVDEVLDIGVKLAGALEAAHARGIVHRDVKPQNVLLSSFVGPVLADFGIAAFDDARLHTVTHEAFSIFHVAPEVLEGHPATPSADLYSLASTLYELVCGRAAFAPSGDTGGDGFLALMRRVRTQPVPPIGREDVSPLMGAELTALLARAPEDRPPSALALAERLRTLQAELGLPPTPLVGWAPAVPPSPGQVDPREPLPTPKLAEPGRSATADRAWAPGPAGTTWATGGTPALTSAPAAGRHTVTVPPPPRPAPLEAPQRSSRGRRWAVLGAAVVLVVGVVLGVWFTRGGTSGEPDGSPALAATDTTATTDPGADPLPPCPTASPGALPAQPFPSGEPPTRLDLEMSDDGATATLRWDDPNDGRNPYLVFVQCDAPEQDDQVALELVSPGDATEATVDGLSLELNYCFTVAVLEPGGTATPYAAPDDTHFRCVDRTTR